MSTEFTQQVIQFIRRVPKGKVATYSQIAALAGKPHAARAVSWILHSSSKTQKLPWYRILSSKGRISFPAKTPSYRAQKRLLKAEGIEFAADGGIAMAQFQWKKWPPVVKGRPHMFGN